MFQPNYARVKDAKIGNTTTGEGEPTLEEIPGHAIKNFQVGLVYAVDREVELEGRENISAVD